MRARAALKASAEDAAEAQLLIARAQRIQPEKAKAAEELLRAIKERHLSVELDAKVLIESGHLYIQHKMYPSAVQVYQTAHDSLPKGSPLRYIATQGGAMCIAKDAKCDRGGKGQECGRALQLFKEVPQEHMQAASWWMVGMISKNVFDDVQAAVEALQQAVAILPNKPAWWDKLARWAQIWHHRIPEGGFTNHAIKQAREAMAKSHAINAHSAPRWSEKVTEMLATAEAANSSEGHSTGICKDTIAANSLGSGFLAPGESSAFTLFEQDPYNGGACESIDISEAPERFYRDFVHGHRPVIIRNATRDWPVPPSGWSEGALSQLSGDELVEVAFTAEDGHLNHFESMENWTHVFTDEHWRVNDRVLVRPKYEHLYFKDFLALLHRGGAAAERNSYLHQTEMNIFLPQIVNNFTRAPSWMPESVWLKEVNLWMSAGGTVTSLHMDTSENIMHMVAGEKEFLLFRPNQIEHLHYESVPEIRSLRRASCSLFLAHRVHLIDRD